MRFRDVGLRSTSADLDCVSQQELPMSGWLTKAADKFRGEQPEQPAPFESTCACGVRHSGLRRRRPQRIICRQCGTALFILPRDVYPVPLPPEPRPKKQGKKKKKRRKGIAAVPPEAPPRFEQVATNVFQASEKVGRKAVSAGARAASAGAKAGSRLGAWFFAFLAIWTPLRLILLGCIGVCAATVAYTLLVDRSEQAVLDLKTANEAARAALTRNDIDTAYEQFTVAVAALDKLDRHDDPLAAEIRQLQRETTAIREAMPISPLQIVTEADAAHEEGHDEQWQQRFRAQYRDRWLVIDGTVQRTASSTGLEEFSVAVPLRIGPQHRAIEMHVAVPKLEKLVAGDEPHAAVFAIQLVGCELSSDGTTWKLQADPESAFLWGTVGNYIAAGFPLDEGEDSARVEQVLASQRRVLGLSASDEIAAVTPKPAADAAEAGEGATE